MAIVIQPPSGVHVIAPAGLPGKNGPKGDPGAGVAVTGTYSGTGTPLPAHPVEGDLWLVGTPVPTLVPPRYDSTPAQPGDGMVWDGSAWVNTGPVQGPEGPPGPVGPFGPPGIVMSPDPPPSATVLWADTDEYGSSGDSGAIAVFAHISPAAGLSASPNATLSIKFSDLTYGQATPLPVGWQYNVNDDTKLIVPPGVYSFYLGWNAPDQYWYGRVQGVYQLGTASSVVDINPGAPVLIESTGMWSGSASGTAVLHNTGNVDDAPWFSIFLAHSQAATGSTAVKWTFNATRLGNLPP